jgi:hypothetical protein
LEFINIFYNSESTSYTITLFWVIFIISQFASFFIV